MSKKSLRSIILNILYPLTRLFGELHIGPRYRKVKHVLALEADSKVKDGDVLCTRSTGEFTNLFIRGDYKHSAICVNGVVVEATRNGVHEIDLYDFLMSKDAFVIMRPKFSFDAKKLRELCKRFDGVPYDYFFSPTIDAFSCAELVGHVLAQSAGSEIPFTKRKILGVYTIHPSDFVEAVDKFERIL